MQSPRPAVNPESESLDRPNALFVYGTLAPGISTSTYWHLLGIGRTHKSLALCMMLVGAQRMAALDLD